MLCTVAIAAFTVGPHVAFLLQECFCVSTACACDNGVEFVVQDDFLGYLNIEFIGDDAFYCDDGGGYDYGYGSGSHHGCDRPRSDNLNHLYNAMYDQPFEKYRTDQCYQPLLGVGSTLAVVLNAYKMQDFCLDAMNISINLTDTAGASAPMSVELLDGGTSIRAEYTVPTSDVMSGGLYLVGSAVTTDCGSGTGGGGKKISLTDEYSGDDSGDISPSPNSGWPTYMDDECSFNHVGTIDKTPPVANVSLSLEKFNGPENPDALQNWAPECIAIAQELGCLDVHHGTDGLLSTTPVCDCGLSQVLSLQNVA